MSKVYLAGPLSDGENPHEWHERIQSLDNSIEWINPFTIHPPGASGDEIYGNDIDALRSSNAVLLRRIDDYEICGAYIEAGIAGADGIPVIVWDASETEPPEFLQWHSAAVCASAKEAVGEVKSHV